MTNYLYKYCEWNIFVRGGQERGRAPRSAVTAVTAAAGSAHSPSFLSQVAGWAGHTVPNTTGWIDPRKATKETVQTRSSAGAAVFPGGAFAVNRPEPARYDVARNICLPQGYREHAHASRRIRR